MPPEDPVTLGEISRRLDDYARTTGVGLEKLSDKLDQMPNLYVSRREYERDDADNEEAHREIRSTIEAIRLEREKTLATVETKIAAVQRTATESRRFAITTAVGLLAIVIAAVFAVINIVAA